MRERVVTSKREKRNGPESWEASSHRRVLGRGAVSFVPIKLNYSEKVYLLLSQFQLTHTLIYKLRFLYF